MMKILVVEDEKELNSSICVYLQSEKYECIGVLNKFDAEDELLVGGYTVLVLDVNLPDGTGLEILHWIKKNEIDISTIIVSARDSLDDRLIGLDTGADDYITKPFHLSELNARIKAILRRKNFNNETSVKFNEWELIPEQRVFKINNTPLNLTPKQYKIVEFFIANKNKVVSKEMLVEYLWKGHALDHDNLEFIYNHVMNVRSMVKKAGGNDYIKTVYGIGYKFTDE